MPTQATIFWDDAPPETDATTDPRHMTIEELRAAGWRATCSDPETCTWREHYFDAEGYNPYGFDRNGYNREGRDTYGFDRDGWDAEGYDRNGYDDDGYNRRGYNRRGFTAEGVYDCEYDEGYELVYDDYGSDDDEGSRYLHPYSYTPTLEFRGERGPYYGMEIEVTTDRVRDAVEIVDEEAGNLIYCKQDGSVRGAELVTHPMSYSWAMERFPWEMLSRLRNEADATVIPQENGIHIHVGRDAFDDAAHVYRWLKLWYRNPLDIQRLARRRSDSWAAFDPDHRRSQVHHAKYGKPAYVARTVPGEGRWRHEMWRPMDQDTTRSTRYAAINTMNDETLEVRVFASTLRPQRARAALQLVASSVEYTRKLTAEAICHRHAWEWRAFMAWVAKTGEYPDLVAENGRRRALSD